MILTFFCSCGNKDPKKAVEYDGCLGYEALICTKCGRFVDHNGEHEADEFSLALIGKPQEGTNDHKTITK